MHAPFAILTLAALTTATTLAEPPCLTYDAAEGTLPDDQGWIENSLDPFTATVINGVLHQSTLPLATISCRDGSDQEQYATWQRSDLDVLFAEGVTVELVARVPVSQFSTNPCEGWPRPGFGFGIEDADKHRVWVGIGSDEIFLATEAYQPFGHPGIATAAFDSTSDAHTYRLDIDGPNAVLSIDDAPVLSLRTYGTPDALGNRIWFGDPTTWANSEVEIASYRVFPLGQPDCEACPADFNGDGNVNILDFVAFQSAFVAQEPSADCDGNGAFNILDFVCFQAVFAQGCP